MLPTEQIFFWCRWNDASQTEVFAHEEIMQSKEITKSSHRTELFGLEFWNACMCRHPFETQNKSNALRG